MECGEITNKGSESVMVNKKKAMELPFQPILGREGKARLMRSADGKESQICLWG